MSEKNLMRFIKIKFSVSLILKRKFIISSSQISFNKLNIMLALYRIRIDMMYHLLDSVLWILCLCARPLFGFETHRYL